jgi:uncharacterized protein
MIMTKHCGIYPVGDQHHILVNSLSGAIDVVDNTTLEDIRELSDNVGGDDGTLVQTLKERGYLFSDREEQDAALGRIADCVDFLTRKNPVMFVICPTGRCNFRCVYCYESEQMRASSKVLGVDEVDRIFDEAIPAIRDLLPPRDAIVELFGGEPLQPQTQEVVRRVFERARSAGYRVTIVTNGYYVRMFKALLSEFAEQVQSVQVTIDGPAEIHDQRRMLASGKGTFAEVAAGIDVLLELGIGVRARINLDAQNLPYLSAIADCIVEKGWHGRENFLADVAPVTDHQGRQDIPNFLPEDELVEKLLPALDAQPRLSEVIGFRTFRVLNHLVSVLEGRKAFGTFCATSYCETNRGEVFVFGQDGYIYACSECLGDPEMAIGRFLPTLELDRSKLFSWSARSFFDLEKCGDCEVAGFCGGGCAYAAIRTNGDIRKPVCNRAPELVKQYIASRQKTLLGMLSE